MKQNLTRKPVISRVFFGYRHNTGMTGQIRHNWPDFFCRERFLRSWINNLMVFKKARLVLKKWSWPDRSWS